MSHMHSVPLTTREWSHLEMLQDHKQILQNYFDTFITRGLSPRTIEVQQRFLEHWFQKIRVADVSGERQIFIWEVMNLGEGRRRIKEFLKAVGTVDEDGQPCLRATTVKSPIPNVIQTKQGQIKILLIDINPLAPSTQKAV